MKRLKVGMHLSIFGSLDRAVDRAHELGCDTLQIFTRNPRGWSGRKLKKVEVEAFRSKCEGYRVEPVFAHMPYLPNLASPREYVYRKSVEALQAELKRCEILGIRFLVTHLGSHLGAGKRKGRERVVLAINRSLSTVRNEVILLLENSAGTRNSIGSRLYEIGEIMADLDEFGRVGLCFDTCHAFAAGYDLKTPHGLRGLIEEIDRSIGLDKLRVVHLNDSKGGLGSRIDRHEHIGMGMIGEKGFINILGSELSRAPLILETPVDNRRSDRENLDKVRELWKIAQENEGLKV